MTKQLMMTQSSFKKVALLNGSLASDDVLLNYKLSTRIMSFLVHQIKVPVIYVSSLSVIIY